MTMTLLIALAPLIVKTGTFLIDLFIKNQADNQAAKLNFIAAIQSHIDDALKSVQAHDSYEQQVGNLNPPDPPTEAKADEVAEPISPAPVQPPAVKTRPFNDYEQKVWRLWTTMQLTSDIHKLFEIKDAASVISKNQVRYQAVADKTGVPWFFIGCLHHMESGNDFTTHLHNGDPLKARTVHVPAGRPKTGNPPFTWEESAIDALNYDGIDDIKNWDIVKMLIKAEEYNGTGYRSRGINTPYVWSYTNQYSKGLYVADHNFDPNAVSEQCGVAAILWQLSQGGVDILPINHA